MAELTVTLPLCVASVAELLMSAPVLPPPLSTKALATVLPFKSSVAVELISLPTVTVPVPKAPLVTVPVEEILAFKVPAVTEVPPL